MAFLTLKNRLAKSPCKSLGQKYSMRELHTHFMGNVILFTKIWFLLIAFTNPETLFLVNINISCSAPLVCLGVCYYQLPGGESPKCIKGHALSI